MKTIDLTSPTAQRDAIEHLQRVRPELVHFAGAMDRDPQAYRVVEQYIADPTASEADLRTRAWDQGIREEHEIYESADGPCYCRICVCHRAAAAGETPKELVLSDLPYTMMY